MSSNGLYGGDVTDFLNGADRSDSSRGGIVTPEAVLLDIETAGIASRATSGAIDYALRLVALIIFLLSGAFAFGVGSTFNTFAAFAVFGVLFGYPILFESLFRGRTPGKAALRLRVVTVDGAPIHLREAALRAMGGVVDLLLPPGGITGVLFVLGTPRNQRIGDLVAGTIVICDLRQYVPAPALWFSPPPGYDVYAAAIDPSAITTEQYTVVRSFLTRVGTLAPHVRAALATDLADRLAAVIHFPRHPDVHPEAFLLTVISRYQRSMTGRHI
jgi:uncharacterized RDD family membrane protein YckC